MIYNALARVRYPSSSIAEDVMSRVGPATEFSFTPYNGMAHLIEEQFKDNAYLFNMDDFLAAQKDFSPKEVNQTVYDEMEGPSALAFNVEGSTLESVDESFVRAYMIDRLIGFKLNRRGGMQEILEKNRSVELRTNEEGITLTESDYLIEDRIGRDDFVEARNRLIYLLKQLHEDSVNIYKVSLLSIIIAYEKNKQLNPKNPAKPQNLIQLGVYAMREDGRFGNRFTIEDNKGRIFPQARKWVVGEYPDSPAYICYQKLLAVLDILEIDITKEKAEDYQGDAISSYATHYLLSNEEYIEVYGLVDPRLINVVKNPTLVLKAEGTLEKLLESPEMHKLLYQDIVNDIGSNMNSIALVANWSYRLDVVDSFLKAYSTLLGPSRSITLNDYAIKNGILAKEDGTYVTVPTNALFYSEYRGSKLLVTAYGYLIATHEFERSVLYVTMEEAIYSIKRFKGKGGENVVDWYVCNL